MTVTGVPWASPYAGRAVDQILRPGERYATPDDWDAIYDQDAPVTTAPLPIRAEGLGCTYWVYVRRDGSYLVCYLPGGPRSGYATVVMLDHATWGEAMDAVRDAIQADLDREGRRPELGTLP